MTWSYSTADLATSTKDQVRMTIGDTDTTAQLLQDEEITWAISVESSMWGAAARCCEAISRNFYRKADVRVGRGGTMVNWSGAAKQYGDMAAAFRKRANSMNSPWAGGTSIAAKDSAAANTDLVQPLFSKNMFNNPWVGSETVESDQDDA